MNDLCVVWSDEKSLTEIKKLFAPKLNATEFGIFTGLGKSLELNPFLREVWAVKYKEDAPAQIFVGRDGYRKNAQKNPEYDYHQVDAVYANDSFAVEDGLVKHAYKLTNRGDLVGAYCCVKRRSSSRPVYVFVTVAEYNTKQSVWNQKPATMIKKVAEAQALRMAFQELFLGTYDESEKWLDADENAILVNDTQGLSATQRIKQQYKARTVNTYEANLSNTDYVPTSIDSTSHTNTEAVKMQHRMDDHGEQEARIDTESAQNKSASKEQILAIERLSHEKSFPVDRYKKALNYYGVALLNELTEKDAEHFIQILINYNHLDS